MIRFAAGQNTFYVLTCVWKQIPAVLSVSGGLAFPFCFCDAACSSGNGDPGVCGIQKQTDHGGAEGFGSCVTSE